MKKNFKVFFVSSAFIFLSAVTFFSCSKNNTSEAPDLTNEQISLIAKDAGFIHNALLAKAGTMGDMGTISQNEYKEKIFSIKLDGFEMPNKFSGVSIDFSGLNDLDAYVDAKFSNKSNIERTFIKEIGHTSEMNTTVKELNRKYNELLIRILNTNELSQNSKLFLSGTLEVARNSIIYWIDATNNLQNPYHIKYTATSNVWPTGTQLVDMVSYGINYEYYSGLGYNPAQATVAAGETAAYQSGLYALNH